MSDHKAIDQYLERHAEAESRAINDARFLKTVPLFSRCVTIVAYAEGTNLLRTLSSIPHDGSGSVLILLVVNAHAQSPLGVHDINAWLMQRLCTLYPPNAQKMFDWLTRLSVPQGELWLIDNTAPARWLDVKEGVGKARKIATDIALTLFSEGHLTTAFVQNTDADVHLPSDYFTQCDRATNASADIAACTYPFRHTFAKAGRLLDNTIAYEQRIRHYVEGLRFAGSPYAHHTIGSTLAIHLKAYAAARGFPKRSAGEDFYLLNKLAKLGRVVELEGTPIHIGARISERTAFGTGMSVKQTLEAKSLLLYHPHTFVVLKAFLNAMASWLNEPKGIPLAQHVARICTLSVLPTEVLQTLTQEINAALRHAPRHARGRQKAFDDYFDAFRTLKFIHALRQGSFADIPIAQALALSPWRPQTLVTPMPAPEGAPLHHSA